MSGTCQGCGEKFYEEVVRGCAARVAGRSIDTDKLIKDVEERERNGS